MQPSANSQAAPRRGGGGVVQEWTESEEAVLREGWLAGRSRYELCLSLPGRSASGIASHATRMGLPRRARDKPIDVAILELPPEAAGREKYQRLGSKPVDVKPTGKTRACNMCQRAFWSDHAGIRTCARCKNSEEYRCWSNV